MNCLGTVMEGKTVYLIRHGIIRSNVRDVYSGRSNEKLTPLGVEYAHELGREMVERGIRTIYSSPLARTMQTAQILNEYIGAQLIENDDLTEMELGPWTGLSKIEVARKYPSEYRMWCEEPAQFRAEGMETLREVQQRAVKALEEVLKAGREDVAAMVTHAVIVKCILLYLQGDSLNAYHTFQVLNLSVHQAVFGAGKSFVDIIKRGFVPSDASGA